jgi:hypothetical protein
MKVPGSPLRRRLIYDGVYVKYSGCTIVEMNYLSNGGGSQGSFPRGKGVIDVSLVE